VLFVVVYTQKGGRCIIIGTLASPAGGCIGVKARKEKSACMIKWRGLHTFEGTVEAVRFAIELKSRDALPSCAL
jgi:hypothetical protein